MKPVKHCRACESYFWTSPRSPLFRTGRSDPTRVMVALHALIAFVSEHRRCGEHHGGLDDGYVWLACSCGAHTAYPATAPPPTLAQMLRARPASGNGMTSCA